MTKKELRNKIEAIVAVIADIAGSHPQQSVYEFLEYDQGIEKLVSLFSSQEARVREETAKEIKENIIEWCNNNTSRSIGFHTRTTQMMRTIEARTEAKDSILDFLSLSQDSQDKVTG